MSPRRRRVRPPASRRSRFALDAVNFFLAELTGIGSPYLSDLLHDRGWGFGAIGIGASMSSLGVTLFQSFAGLLLDRARHPRIILAASSVAVGACYAALPFLAKGPHGVAYATLFASGIAQSFFGPLLAGLALGIVGHGHLNRTFGVNQAWNHLGDVAAALIALAIIGKGIAAVFYLIGVVAVLAAILGLVIRKDEIDVDQVDRRQGAGRSPSAPSSRTGASSRCSSRSRSSRPRTRPRSRSWCCASGAWAPGTTWSRSWSS